MDRKKHLLLLSLALSCVGSVYIVSRQSPRVHPQPIVVDHSSPAKTVAELKDPVDQIEQQLIDAGWDRACTKRVVRLNREWFTLLAHNHPEHFTRQIHLLACLGAHPEISDVIFRRPETASLLAMAERPQRLARVLRESREHMPWILGLYVRHAAHSDAARLTEALEGNRLLITKLLQKGLIGSEALFILDRKQTADREYELWLREVLTAKLNASKEQLASMVHLLLNQGDEIRRRLKKDADFRRQFRRELWPKLHRVVMKSGGMFEFYLDEPHVWEVLKLPEGERLLKDWGPLAPRLLFAKDGYDDSLQEKVIQALLLSDNLAVQALIKYRKNESFRKLLKRPLTARTMTHLLRRLNAAGEGVNKLLKYYEGLSNTALSEEVGPPPSGAKTWIPLYFTWYAGKKLIQGRKVNALDWVTAVIDPASFALPLVKGLGAGKRIGAALFNATLKRTGVALARRQFNRDITGSLEKIEYEPELLRWSITELLTRLQKPMKVHTRQEVVDITRPVELIFQYAHLGSTTLQSWKTFNARLLMRRDGRAFLHFGTMPMHLELLSQLNERAEKIIPGENSPSESGRLRAWQQHVSAWWLMNASGMIMH